MNNIHYDAWYYVIYLIPGGAAALLILLTALGGGRHGHHAGGHLGHTGPVTAGHTGLHGHAGLHPRIGTAKAHAGAKGIKTRGMPQALAFFGAGRVPPTLAWGSFLLGWGLFGFWATRLLEPALRFPVLFALPALIAAIAGGLGASRLTAYLWARLLPAEETFVTGTVDLCGLSGTVVYPVFEWHSGLSGG